MVKITAKKSVGTIPQSGDIIQYAYSLYIYIKALILEQLPYERSHRSTDDVQILLHYCYTVVRRLVRLVALLATHTGPFTTGTRWQ